MCMCVKGETHDSGEGERKEGREGGREGAREGRCLSWGLSYVHYMDSYLSEHVYQTVSWTHQECVFTRN